MRPENPVPNLPALRAYSNREVTTGPHVGSPVVVDIAALAVTIPLLVVALIIALRGRGESAQALVAVLGAMLAVLVGAIGGGPATDEVYAVGPTLLFLAVLLVLSHLADAEGVFTWAAAVVSRRAGNSPIALFRRIFVLAAVTTAILNLDATVVLLTPVVIATVRRMRFAPGPHTYACAHLANSASLLMPISNLTNLLAFAATGLSFLAFTGLMALPWVVAIGVEYLLLRRTFAADLTQVSGQADTGQPPPAPRLALTVVSLTVLGFAATSLIGVAPIWSAVAGVAVLAVPRLIHRKSTAVEIIESANLSFLLFVLGLAVIVRGVTESGLGDLIAVILPSGLGLGALLVTAAIAALLANLVNNLPATLALVPAAATVGTPAILAVLIGVNVGANLSYVGSVANLLWRRVVSADGGTDHRVGREPTAPNGSASSARQFTTIGLLTVPLTLAASTTALWLSWQLFG